MARTPIAAVSGHSTASFPASLMGAGYLTASYARVPWLIVVSLGLSFVAFMSMQGPALAVPTQFLAGRAAAAGIAAMNTITMFSGFIGPYWMGVTERCNRQLLAWPARPPRAKSWRCARHVSADTQSRANLRDGTESQPSPTSLCDFWLETQASYQKRSTSESLLKNSFRPS